jgi:hypothetical protein
MSNLSLSTEPPSAAAARSPRMPSVDLYGPPHKALRLALCTLLVRMGATSFADEEDASSVLADLEDVLHHCEAHLRIEEKFIHPALGRGGIVARMDAQHVRHDQAVERLRTQSRRIAETPPEGRAPLARALFLAFGDFVAETLEHMTEEETTVQALLEELHPPEELARIQQVLIASIPPDHLFATLRFMLPAMNREERAGMLSGAKAKMPPPAFAAVMGLAKDVLRPNELRDLEDRLRA